MAAPRRVAVIGTVVRDTIHLYGGRIEKAWGGILYAILPLRALLPEEVELVPVMRVGADLWQDVCELLAPLPNVARRAVARDPRPNNAVELRYQTPSDRTERLTGGVGPLTAGQLREVEGADLLLVNFIAGREMSLSALRGLRGIVEGPIYGDLHSLCLGRTGTGERYPRRPRRWEDWIGALDYVQANEQEAQVILGERGGRARGARSRGRPGGSTRDAASERAIPERFAEKVHPLGPEVACVTLGERGAAYSWQEQGGVRRWGTCAASRVPVVDPTGCGDVFGAAFVAALVRGLGIPEAVRAANGAAALSVTQVGAEGLYRFFRGRWGGITAGGA